MAKPRLIKQIRDEIRRRNYSYRTEQSYVRWIIRFVKFCGTKHPLNIDPEEITHFLNYLSVTRKVAASTQNQALYAIVFLYHEVLEKELPKLKEIEWAKRPRKLPVVLTSKEIKILMNELEGIPLLVAQLLYGSGLRISEALRIRVKDIDFGYKQLLVRDGKGKKDRITIMPAVLISRLKRQIEQVKILHKKDKKRGYGEILLPNALNKKFPHAASY